ncbi:MAG: Unknown protein [uncultured Campylobacterales bacterium]|uniref:Lipoprotein n=1 Tax=uncultured Campylobacterales bacterium TaxID=352960 RepID=A0A6S6TCA2_9BACT|nr:MAG: Unknown protein [uncultured Campylobacterales bacterium]
MNKIIFLLSLFLFGCEEHNTNEPTTTQNLPINTIQTTDSNETIEYLESLLDNDMNSLNYTLPPDPADEGKKDIFGIDTNQNGIRDDVEIYIYNKYKNERDFRRILTAIASQYAIAMQKTLIDSKNAYENKSYYVMNDVLDCYFYFKGKITKDRNLTFNESYNYFKNKDPLTVEAEDVFFNTKNRIKEYLKYNRSLSGNIFPSRSQIPEKCETNLNKLGEI